MFTSIFLKRFYFNISCCYLNIILVYFIIKRYHHYFINYLIIFWNVFNRREDKQYTFIMNENTINCITKKNIWIYKEIVTYEIEIILYSILH